MNSAELSNWSNFQPLNVNSQYSLETCLWYCQVQQMSMAWAWPGQKDAGKIRLRRSISQVTLARGQHWNILHVNSACFTERRGITQNSVTYFSWERNWRGAPAQLEITDTNTSTSKESFSFPEGEHRSKHYAYASVKLTGVVWAIEWQKITSYNFSRGGKGEGVGGGNCRCAGSWDRCHASLSLVYWLLMPSMMTDLYVLKGQGKLTNLDRLGQLSNTEN